MPPPLGSLGGWPGGRRPKLPLPECGVRPWLQVENRCRFRSCFLLVLGPIGAPSWSHVGVVLAPLSAQVGPKTVFESYYPLKKYTQLCVFHRFFPGVVHAFHDFLSFGRFPCSPQLSVLFPQVFPRFSMVPMAFGVCPFVSLGFVQFP